MSRIAIRYSKAFFELALEKDKLSEAEQDIMLVKDQIFGNDDFEKLLQNPLIPANVKTDLLKKTFKNSIGDFTMNFLVLTGNKKRSDFLVEIIDKFEALALDHNGIISAQVYSAIPLKDDQKNAIQYRLEKRTGKKVHLEETIEKSLLGGFIVKIRDSVTDYSIKRQLERLKNKMIFG